MAPLAMKRKAESSKDAIKSRCALVKKAVEHAEECPDRVKDMLSRTLSVTIGTPKADRHPFNDRFVAMIEQALDAEQTRMKKDVAAKEAAFSELSPAKATREAALEQAKADATEKKESLNQANQAVIEVGATVKEATTELAKMRKAQKAGDKELDGITAKKASLEATQMEQLHPIMAATGTEELAAEVKDRSVKAVLKAGASFGFDPSLMSTAAQVLEKPAGERGAFDNTCLEQLKEAFVSAVANFNEGLAAGAPGKAERAAAVEQADAKYQAAEASEKDLKEKAASAKEAKAASDAAAKVAARSLADFMPDLKQCGDALDDAKVALQAFIDGPHTAFGELKEFKEDDFQPKKVCVEQPTEADENKAPEAEENKMVA